MVVAPVTGSVVVVVVEPVALLKLAPLPNAPWKPWLPLPLTKPLEAEILERAALDLGEADFEHDLLRRADRQQVDDLARGIGFGELDRAVGGRAAADDAFEHDRIIGDAGADLVARASARTIGASGR